VYRVGIQQDASGNPSGTYVTSGTFVASANGWQTIHLSPAFTPTDGAILHIVTSRVSGNNSLTLYASTPQQNVLPSSGELDTQQQTLTSTNGTTWTAANRQPVVLLTDTLQQSVGNTYTTTANRQIWGTNEIGQVISVNQDTIIEGSAFAASRSNVPAGNLMLTIRDLTANTVLGQATIATPIQATTTINWIATVFQTPITLPALHSIRLELSSPSSTQSSRRYNVPLHSSLTASPYRENTYKGLTSYGVTKTGSTWTQTTASDMPFQLQAVQGFAPNGTYESSIFDTGNSGTVYGTILWLATVPSGTSLSIQTKTANTQAGLASAQYVGPDGTTATNYSSNDSIALAAGSTGTQYIQYRVQFSGTSSSTPQFEDIQIAYE
jgi:hypothetical protein